MHVDVLAFGRKDGRHRARHCAVAQWRQGEAANVMMEAAHDFSSGNSRLNDVRGAHPTP
jgi:hypothetical protein